MRFELIREISHMSLKHARLPFRHTRKKDKDDVCMIIFI